MINLGRLPGLYYLSYNLWQRRALRIARRLHRDVGFDLLHQVNYCGFREPGYLWKLGVPFVWGPIGGTQNYPSGQLRQAGLIGGTKEILRTSLNQLTIRHSRRVRLAAQRASALRAANRSIARDLNGVLDVPNIPVMLEVGAPPIKGGDPLERTPRGDDEFRILWAGEFRAFKAMPHLLNALAGLPAELKWELVAAGDGPDRRRWRRQAQRLGIDDRISWVGWISHSEMDDLYANADVFVFTSLRDTTGSVMLEALGAGTPVIAPDHQGAADVVTNACGIKIPLTSERDMVAAYGEALERLACDPDLLAQLSSGARLRARHYAWERQGERMRDVYMDVLGRQSAEDATH